MCEVIKTGQAEVQDSRHVAVNGAEAQNRNQNSQRLCKKVQQLCFNKPPSHRKIETVVTSLFDNDESLYKQISSLPANVAPISRADFESLKGVRLSACDDKTQPKLKLLGRIQVRPINLDETSIKFLKGLNAAGAQCGVFPHAKEATRQEQQSWARVTFAGGNDGGNMQIFQPTNAETLKRSGIDTLVWRVAVDVLFRWAQQQH